MKNFKPVGKWILVNIVEAGQTVGGLFVPQSAKGSKQYIVREVGEEVTKCKQGDEVISAGNVISLDNFDIERGQGLIHQDHLLGALSK